MKAHAQLAPPAPSRAEVRAELLDLVEEQKRLGLHSSHAWRVCASCGDWTDGAAACDPQNTRRGFCRTCAVRAGLIKAAGVVR